MELNKYEINYSEVSTGCVIVEASSEDDAIAKYNELNESGELSFDSVRKIDSICNLDLSKARTIYNKTCDIQIKPSMLKVGDVIELTIDSTISGTGVVLEVKDGVAHFYWLEYSLCYDCLINNSSVDSIKDSDMEFITELSVQMNSPELVFEAKRRIEIETSLYSTIDEIGGEECRSNNICETVHYLTACIYRKIFENS